MKQGEITNQIRYINLDFYNDCQALLLQYMMQSRRTQESQLNNYQNEYTLNIGQQVAKHSQKSQGAGISQLLRNCLGRIEDRLFQQANQIFLILQDEKQVKVDGYTYSTIQQSNQLRAQLQKVRMNAPIYQNMSSNQKKKLFQKLGVDYCLNLQNKKINSDQEKTYIYNEETHELSQNSIIKDRKFGKKIKKVQRSKISLISELNQIFEEPESMIQSAQVKTVKKVCFLSESCKKYFAKEEAVATVSIQRTYVFSTLDKI